jgi:ankyrin repeat protein
MRVRLASTFLVAIYCVTIACIPLPAVAQSKPMANRAALSARIQLDPQLPEPTILYDSPVRVVLSNHSDQPIRLWNPESKQGYQQISFQFAVPKSDKVHVVRRREILDEGYWKAVAGHGKARTEVIEVAAKGEVTWEIDLSDFAWGERAWRGMPSPNAKEPYSVTVQISNALDDRGRIWRGVIQSEPVSARFVAPRLQTPHQYLWDGFAEKAIEMMKADAKWVNARDKDQCMPLHHAARFGTPAAVAWLLEHGANVDVEAYNRFTPLHFAEDPEIVRLILQKKPNLKRSDVQGQTPLQEAASKLADARAEKDRENWRQIVKLYTDALGGADLISAITLGDLARVKAILSESPKLADDFQGTSPLRVAAGRGHLEICKYLVDEFHVDVNDWQRGVGYPIIKGALKHPKVVRLLIEKGADLKKGVTWQGGRTGVWIIGDDATLLHYAAADGVPETVNLLLDHGVDPFALDAPFFNRGESQTALEIAAYFGKADNAAAIVNHARFDQATAEKQQALLDKCLRWGAHPTWLAREPDRPKLMEVLIKKGANPNTSEKGYTPLLIAAAAMHPGDDVKQCREIIAVLRRHGTKMDLYTAVAIGDEALVQTLLKGDRKLANTRGPDGIPALHIAVKMNYPKVVRALLNSGADVNIRNESETTGSVGDTPLDWADFWERDEIAKLLKDAGGK